MVASIQQMNLFTAANNYANLVESHYKQKHGPIGVQIVLETLQGFTQALTDAKVMVLYPSDGEHKTMQEATTQANAEIRQEVAQAIPTRRTPTEQELASIRLAQQAKALAEQQRAIQEQQDAIAAYQAQAGVPQTTGYVQSAPASDFDPAVQFLGDAQEEAVVDEPVHAELDEGLPEQVEEEPFVPDAPVAQVAPSAPPLIPRKPVNFLDRVSKFKQQLNQQQRGG